MPMFLTTCLLGAVDVQLTAEEIQQLEEPYKPVKVFGH